MSAIPRQPEPDHIEAVSRRLALSRGAAHRERAAAPRAAVHHARLIGAGVLAPIVGPVGVGPEQRRAPLPDVAREVVMPVRYAPRREQPDRAQPFKRLAGPSVGAAHLERIAPGVDASPAR